MSRIEQAVTWEVGPSVFLIWSDTKGNLNRSEEIKKAYLNVPNDRSNTQKYVWPDRPLSSDFNVEKQKKRDPKHHQPAIRHQLIINQYKK